MDFNELVRIRRSARKFRPDPVPGQALDSMLEAARLAPSGGNAQSHRFGVVTDPAIKKALAEAAGGQMWIADAPVVIACCAEIGQDLATLPEDDFGLRVNYMRFGREFVDYLKVCPDRHACMTFFQNAVPLIPTEHIVLAAAEHGLSCCMIGWLDIKKAGEILNLPSGMVCLFLLPVGYPAEQPREKKVKRLEEIVFTIDTNPQKNKCKIGGDYAARRRKT